MPTRHRKRAARPTRPIKTKRDYEGAKAVVKRISGDSTAELRLKSLLAELDKYDEPVEEDDEDPAEDTGYAGPRRRWSDDDAGTENT